MTLVFHYTNILICFELLSWFSNQFFLSMRNFNLSNYKYLLSKYFPEVRLGPYISQVVPLNWVRILLTWRNNMHGTMWVKVFWNCTNVSRLRRPRLACWQTAAIWKPIVLRMRNKHLVNFLLFYSMNDPFSDHLITRVKVGQIVTVVYEKLPCLSMI